MRAGIFLLNGKFWLNNNTNLYEAAAILPIQDGQLQRLHIKTNIYNDYAPRSLSTRSPGSSSVTSLDRDLHLETTLNFIFTVRLFIKGRQEVNF
jgi:hypothetical protein